MSRNVYYTVPSDVLSLHALTLRSTVTLSFQYKCQTARCNVYSTPSLTVWFVLYIYFRGISASIIIAKLTFKFINCVVKFTYIISINYDIENKPLLRRKLNYW